MYQLENSIKNIINYSFLPSTNNIVHIGYGIDNNYCRCCAISICSFCKNNPETNFQFHIMISNLDIHQKQYFQILAKNFSINITIYEIDISFFKQLPSRLSFPLPTYFRFILPLILKDLNKVFYIDADILCLNSANDLFNTDLDSSTIIAAVPDTIETATDRNTDLGLTSHIYFNAGVLLIDIQKWNKFNIFDKLIKEILNNPKKFYMLDQDALNLILTQKIHYLPKKFNYFNGFYPWNKNIIANKEIILLHFTSSPKPWDLGWEVSPMSNEYNRELYKSYENYTPWKNSLPVYPKHYRRLRIYAKDLYHHGYYLKSFKYYFAYLLAKLKSRR